MYAAFFTGNCDAITSDVSQLANVRGISREHSGSYSILPEIFRNDPLAPASDGADGRFATIIAWTVDTLIRAEELGVTQAKVDALQASDDPEVKALLGDKFGTGAKLGLDDHWGANVLKATGNYGEIFDRDLGEKSPFRLDRGANRLWKNGGAMIALPPEN
jgi:general L-amino acid transport system substrate-binding protein